MEIKVKTLKLLLYLTLAGLALMAGLVVTGLTLASRYSRATVTEQVGIEAMVSLSPTYGGANTFVNITGIGFPHDSRVRLYRCSPHRACDRSSRCGIEKILVKALVKP